MKANDRSIKGAFEAIGAQIVNIALAILFVGIWLGLSAYLDEQPSETDALQASALELADAIADANKREVTP